MIGEPITITRGGAPSVDSRTRNGDSVLPGAHVEDSALPLLTEERKPLAAKMVCIMEQMAARQGVASRITICSHLDYESGTEWLTIRQAVDLPPDEGWTFLEQVGAEIEKWIATLPPSQADVVYDEIFTQTDWNMK